MLSPPKCAVCEAEPQTRSNMCQMCNLEADFDAITSTIELAVQGLHDASDRLGPLCHSGAAARVRNLLTPALSAAQHETSELACARLIRKRKAAKTA